MSTRRSRELWVDRESGDTYAVEVEDSRVLSADGPVDENDVGHLARMWQEPEQGRRPAFTELAAELMRRRDDFDRRPFPSP